MIDRGSLFKAPLPRASQQPSPPLVNPEATASIEAIQELLKPLVEDLGKTKEELGAERVRREQAERERDELRTQLEAIQETPQAPESAAEEPDKVDTPDRPEGSQEGAERRGWWRRWFSIE